MSISDGAMKTTQNVDTIDTDGPVWSIHHRKHTTVHLYVANTLYITAFLRCNSISIPN